MNLLEFVHDSNAASSALELQRSLLLFLGEFGLSRFIIGDVALPSSAERERAFGQLTNYPQEWVDYYLCRHYVNYDPVLRETMRNRGSFTWAEAKEKARSLPGLTMMDEAAECGLRNGVGVSLPRPSGSVIGFGFAGLERCLRVDRAALSVLRVAAFQFYVVYADLAGLGPPPSSPFTEREREVLCWAAVGRSKSEIADLLLVSESSVKRYCENIFQKLDANTMAFAVAKAIHLGAIDPF
jgi:LuxR family transcriptional regulator, quorum-sensing system regulator BjaR1